MLFYRTENVGYIAQDTNKETLTRFIMPNVDIFTKVPIYTGIFFRVNKKTFHLRLLTVLLMKRAKDGWLDGYFEKSVFIFNI